MSREATIFGTAVAVIVCGALGWWLSSIKSEIPLWLFAPACLLATGGILLLARWMDKKDAARRERE